MFRIDLLTRGSLIRFSAAKARAENGVRHRLTPSLLFPVEVSLRLELVDSEAILQTIDQARMNFADA
jgi:hypothetical protein